MRGPGDGGDASRASERGHNYHMQSREAARDPGRAELRNHLTWALCYYGSEQRNLLPRPSDGSGD